MKSLWFLAALLFLLVPLWGCNGTPPAPLSEKEKAIEANLAKLSPEDRAAAQAQKYCAVENDNRLGGSMGPPVKIMIKGQPVFLCCDGCKDEALADPDKTLAKVAELKDRLKKGLDK